MTADLHRPYLSAPSPPDQHHGGQHGADRCDDDDGDHLGQAHDARVSGALTIGLLALVAWVVAATVWFALPAGVRL